MAHQASQPSSHLFGSLAGPARLARRTVAALLLVVLSAQVLGLVHGITHGISHGQSHESRMAKQPAISQGTSAERARSHAHAPDPDQRHVHAATHAAVGTPAADGLFGHEADETAQCLLFDQMGAVEALCLADWRPSQAPPPAWQPTFAATPRPHAIAGLPQARAPPLTS